MEFDQGALGTNNNNPLLLQDYSLLSALVVLICECIHCFDEEIMLIWNRGWTPVKYAYLFSRYGVIAIHLTNYVIFQTTISSVPVPSENCTKWYAFQTASLWCSFAACDAVIMLRVYALHRKSPRMRTLLITLHLCEAVCIGCANWRFFGTVVFDDACNASNVTKDAAIFSGGVIVVQSIVWSLTSKKRDTGNGEMPIVELILRDKKWVWGFLSVLYTVAPVSSVRQNVRAHTSFTIPIALLSIAACRLALNMQATPMYSSENDGSAIELRSMARTASLSHHTIPVRSPPSTTSRRSETASLSQISTLTSTVSYPSSTTSRRSDRVSSVDDLESNSIGISSGANLTIEIGSRFTGSEHMASVDNFATYNSASGTNLTVEIASRRTSSERVASVNDLESHSIGLSSSANPSIEIGSRHTGSERVAGVYDNSIGISSSENPSIEIGSRHTGSERMAGIYDNSIGISSSENPSIEIGSRHTGSEHLAGVYDNSIPSIEIGSRHTASSSMNSQGSREFWEAMYD